MNKLQWFAFAVLASVASVTGAQQAPPPPGPPRPFQLPTPVTISLPNGVQATFVDFGVIPKVSVAVAVRTGNLNEGDKTWLADLTGDLLKEGTKDRNSGQIADAATLMGGQLGISVTADETLLSLDVLSEYGADAVGLLAEVLTTPALPESELARIRQDYLRNLSVQTTQPQAIAGAAMADLLYPDHPYGKSFPTVEQLNSYSIADIRGYYDANFGARRTHVYVAGRFDRAAIEKAIRESLGGWREGAPPLQLAPTDARPRTVKLLDRPGAPQSTLRIGKRVIDPTQPNFMPLSVANTMLGGVLTSRITMNLREAKGWAYSPGSGIATQYHQATWLENADVKSAQTGPSVSEIFKEIDLLRSEAPTEPELTSIKNYRNGIFVMSTSTRGGLIGQLAFMNLQGLPSNWLTTFVDRLYAVTPAQITQAARDHLDPTQMSVVIVGDLATVKPQIEAIAPLRDAIAKP
ncbi:putative Zn-dependent peptidase [Povalibacter uvarum]|uniref:Putative Zn-dependent peptidase n=1 Tax=Povalibacter uvarum TaxID=732238 RepID=A0A841HQN4_9GAMM|nr:pitrilysin family protein [Povalibacter uvarum]MBB6094418.1 putative Zn-dependent peptidase [Povalibacter uvarum]